MRVFFAFALCAFLLSCTDTIGVFPSASVSSQIRTSSGFEVEITTTNDNLVELEAEVLNLSNPGTESFTVVVNPGLLDQQTFTAVSVSATHAEDGLRIVKNPGLSQTVYEDKATITVTPYSSTTFQASINPGSIFTTATSIIVEEMGGI